METTHNKLSHPFIEAILDQSYSTVLSMINNKMSLEAFNQKHEALGNKPILAYLIDDLATMTGYKDRAEKQKKNLEVCIDYYNSLGVDDNIVVDLAKQAIVKSYKWIDSDNYKDKGKDFFEDKNYLNIENISNIFNSYDVEVLNAIKINYQGEDVDLASWLLFNIKQSNLLKTTIVSLKKNGYDFSNSIYDLTNIAISNDIANHNFYYSSLLLPKKAASFSDYEPQNKILEILSDIQENSEQKKTVLDDSIVDVYNKLKNMKNSSTGFFDFMSPENGVPRRYLLKDLLKEETAGEVDSTVKCLNAEDISICNINGQSFLSFLIKNKGYSDSNKKNYLKVQRLSAKNPDWFQGNEFGFGLYDFISIGHASGRDDTYMNKIADNILTQYDLKTILKNSSVALKKMKDFHV